MEKEVSIPELLKDIRRNDEQRISIPIFECFLCASGMTNEDSCQGYMFYIMEKGVGNCEELIRTHRAPFATNEAKVILIRDMLV